MRKSNIELLRILAMLGVILLHYNNPLMGGAASCVRTGELKWYILFFSECVAIPAVDLFILITGYFMCESNTRNPYKAIWLLVQLILFSVARSLAGMAHSGQFSGSGLLEALVPNNYYVILYCALFFISPFINVLYGRLSEKNRKQLLITVLVLFALWPTLGDILIELTHREWNGVSTIGLYGSQFGYTIVNFTMMYLIGTALKKTEFASNPRVTKGKILAGILVNLGILMVWSCLEKNVPFIEKAAWEYCNPFVVSLAVLYFVLFSKLDIRSSKIINGLAGGSFTAYLLHTFFLKYIKIESFIRRGTGVYLLHLIGSCVAIYLICYGVYWIYEKITSPLFRRIERKIQLPVLRMDDK